MNTDNGKKPMKVLATVPSKLPLHLAHPPLAEATFELRFRPTQPSIAQLLPGIIYAKLGGKYGRSEALPFASIPSQIRVQMSEKDSNLLYQAEYRLSEEGASIFVGERIAGVSMTAPYEGWHHFRPRILEFLEILRSSGLVEKVERFSIKATNIIPATGVQLDLLNLRAEIGGISAPEKGFRFRTEINDKTLNRIIEVSTNATVQFHSGETTSGLLLSLDCVRPVENEDYWSIHEKALDEVYRELKELFFGLITQEGLESLGPSYE
jgi:uncharacterized protein (TIGR04255 family)